MLPAAHDGGSWRLWIAFGDDVDKTPRMKTKAGDIHSDICPGIGYIVVWRFDPGGGGGEGGG